MSKKMMGWREIFDLPAWEIFPGTPEQRPFNVMQYTGLKDKNGKEIYEGDILKEKDIVTKVVFHDFRWQEKLISSPRNHLKNYFPFRDTLPFTAVVIGNIYENPELLEN
ncbi:YopX family protein [Bacillus cereus]|nr:YopX family protein [Bacillus thuringiensis]EEM32006.1 hypothetical protein bthur0003_55190 [Bacillus thuringiensis serovar thuringiensis str. T01001]EEM63115.1 hypothetical protein bthur0008_53070 [Bacillus thuringiensis serovar berliner ATCC 10792]MEC3304426.1 YopX family protein [Bacillus cereus]OTW38738.1 hypothetical protein BK698_25655 [Bacillus thuringiensis serovar thuringiensis]ARP61773.1 hypothetical protein CAB88_32285 [Bacillus thuringiensis]